MSPDQTKRKHPADPCGPDRWGQVPPRDGRPTLKPSLGDKDAEAAEAEECPPPGPRRLGCDRSRSVWFLWDKRVAKSVTPAAARIRGDRAGFDQCEERGDHEGCHPKFSNDTLRRETARGCLSVDHGHEPDHSNGLPGHLNAGACVPRLFSGALRRKRSHVHRHQGAGPGGGGRAPQAPLTVPRI